MTSWFVIFARENFSTDGSCQNIVGTKDKNNQITSFHIPPCGCKGTSLSQMPMHWNDLTNFKKQVLGVTNWNKQCGHSKVKMLLSVWNTASRVCECISASVCIYCCLSQGDKAINEYLWSTDAVVYLHQQGLFVTAVPRVFTTTSTALRFCVAFSLIEGRSSRAAYWRTYLCGSQPGQQGNTKAQAHHSLKYSLLNPQGFCLSSMCGGISWL